MAKAIYSIKIWLFRKQLGLKAADLNGFKHICIFIVKVYIFVWYTAQSPISAPLNDLNLIKNLLLYKKVNASVSNACLITMSRHLSYVSEELASISFFDVSIPNQIKQNMVHAINHREGKKENFKKLNLKVEELKKVSNVNIDYFITKNSFNFFNILGIDTTFLNECPKTWAENKAYLDGLKIVQSLKVVNDCAERGVALIQMYSGICKDESQQQYLLQLIENHRKQLSSVTKSALLQYLQK